MTSAPTLPAAVTRFLARRADTFPRIAEILFVLLLAQALAALAWTLVPAPEGSQWRVPTPAATTAASVARGPDVERIAAAHLFGEYQAPAVPEQSALNEVPDTRLDVTLLGILAATAERGSRALIASSNGEEKPYAIGDDLVRGARLQAIFPDRVILSRAGQLETLRLDKDAPRTTAAPEATAAPDRGADADTTQMLTNIRQELLTDPGRAAEYIRVQPASSGGQLRGYRIYPGRNRAAFSAVGLRPGDLVTQVNGIQLTDANTALQMLGQLSQSNHITMVVERGGQQQTVDVNFN